MLLPAWLLLTQTAYAGWLGVWTYEDCVKSYAVPAQTGYAVGIATRACRAIYVEKEDGAAKAADQCTLDGILNVKTENAGGILARTCRNSAFCPHGGEWHPSEQVCE
jgi:hypothetical protein